MTFKELARDIILVKDIRAEMKAQGTAINIASSRKFWGPVLIIAGQLARDNLNINLDDAALNQASTLIVDVVTYAMQGFGILQQIISYGTLVLAAIRKRNDPPAEASPAAAPPLPAQPDAKPEET